MFYSSTRNNDTKVASADAIIKGLAPDRGLYTPVSIPVLSSCGNRCDQVWFL